MASVLIAMGRDDLLASVLPECHGIQSGLPLTIRKAQEVWPRSRGELRANHWDASHGTQECVVVVLRVRHVIGPFEEGCLRDFSTCNSMIDTC